MKKKPYFPLILIILGVVIALVILDTAISCFVTNYRMNRASQSLDQGRPAGAEIIPNPQGEITDVRILPVQREYEPFMYAGESAANYRLIQVWYGYQADGNWFDYPSENYDLIGILNGEGDNGWEAAYQDHMVQIGPYLIICIVGNDPLVISDTINSPVLDPFTQYVFENSGTLKYGHLSEDPAMLNDSEKHPDMIELKFRNRYYLVLEYAKLPDDYEVFISDESGQNPKDSILTIQKIRVLLDE